MQHLFGFCVKEKESQILLLLLYFILSISAAAALYSIDANVRRKLSKLGYKQIAVVIFPEKKFFFSSSFSSGKLQVVISPQFMRIVQA
ncbi:hypothetical protein LOK49_LG01G03208 [Camellia lanceoleosa]|uniref:Uncharacterized protein n=1 Tax=Camellia lanceoleosa TaxID=1840588 RepID=A0ACC0J301_9ERIC|nr:hypothetical protein LOK49_LG01G03208 [Camellia lanceoleosa]